MSKDESPEPVTENVWRKLNAFTDARIGLGRAGVSLPTQPMLAFQLAHAQAMDAEHTQLDVTGLSERIMAQPWCHGIAPLHLHSRATDRSHYLQRPDWGRLLDEASAVKLDRHRADHADGYDLVVVVVDGLSSRAIEQNALPFLNALFADLDVYSSEAEEASAAGWTVAPLCIVEQGRVAIGDDICQRLNARCVLVLIGERPGLSSPDSMGLYLTWNGRVGLTDACRNCISNIRPAGLRYQEAARKALYLLKEARNLKLSGVKLKDRADDGRVLGADHNPGGTLPPG